MVDEYKKQGRRFRWIKFTEASKQQIEALFTWQETLGSWHLWEVIEAADNACQQRLASVETAGAVVPQEHPDQDRAGASGAAASSSKVEDWLRPLPPPTPSWQQDPPREPLPRHRPSAEERQVLRGAAKTALRGVYAKAAETRQDSSRERSPLPRSRPPSSQRQEPASGTER